MNETLTQKQREAVEALEGARRAGVPLSDYAKAKGLELRPVYDAIATLRRRGALPPADRPRRRKSKSRFVAVRLTSSTASVAAARSGLVCRLVRSDGCTIECSGWPEPKWVAAVLAGWRVGGLAGCCGLIVASSACICIVHRWTCAARSMGSLSWRGM